MIGWYVHHVGQGHVTRARTIRARLRGDVVMLSSLPGADHDPDRVVLERDDGGSEFVDPSANGRLHWVPTGHAGLRNRMAQLAEWIATNRPDLLVVDVSVEVTMLARLLGVPVIVMAMPGRRDDPAHQLAYDIAARIIAPWTREVYDPPFLRPFAAKTAYVGAISRFDGRVPTQPTNPQEVVVLNGAGGDAVPAAAVAQAIDGSARRWTGLGVGDAWVDDVWPVLSRAGVVVCHGGQNALAEVAAARRPAVVVAQDRPFDEQHDVATALARAGIVEYRERWPAAGEWPGILADAARRGGAGWERWSNGSGAQQAAAIIEAGCP